MKKKVTIGLIGTVAAASIATNLLMEPEQLLHSEEQLRQQARVENQSDQQPVELASYSEEGELSAADALRAQIIRLPVVVKAVILLPLWALGAIPVAIGTALAGALAPFWAQIAGFLLQTAVLVGAFCLVYKLLFPKRPIKELFKKKTFPWLLAGAGGVTAANLALGLVWPQWTVWRGALLAAVGFGVLALLWRRVCQKLPGPKPQPKQTTLSLQFD